MVEFCYINISTLKQKLANFEMVPRPLADESDVQVFKFSAGGHDYELKLKFVTINFDGSNFVGANGNWNEIKKE